MGNKIDLKRFYKINAHYKELQQKANEFYKELKELNSCIDLDEVKKDCSYNEVKEIYDIMKYCTSDKSVLEEIMEIMTSKKNEETTETYNITNQGL